VRIRKDDVAIKGLAAIRTLI